MRFTEARAKYKAIEATVTFEQARSMRDQFEQSLKVMGKPLEDAPKLPNGSVADEHKTPEWRLAYCACEALRIEYRGFMEMYARRFKKEIRVERDAKRGVVT